MGRYKKVDPFRLEVMKQRLCAVAEEMGANLGRSASSVNIKERKDYSCAIFDERGRALAQAAHIPVHLGSMPLSVAAAVASHRFRPGDTVVLNDPYHGGTHLPDVTMVRAVFIGKRIGFYTACRAHYADIGGMTPGSMPVSRELFQEGLILPPVLLDATVRKLLMANVRSPGLVRGDLAAQEAACAVGEERLRELVGSCGYPTVRRYSRALQEYSRRLMEAAISRIPSGTYRYEDVLDDDGVGHGPIPIRVAIRRRGRHLTFDFTGSSPQVEGNVNAVFAVTLSAVLYCCRCLVREEIPMNAGAGEPIKVIAPEGSILNARPPAAVAAGNVETSQRVVDVVLGALAKALPDVIPAASAGTMSNLSFGGSGFAYYETIGGGMGAHSGGRGESAIQTHMTNTMNTPIEALEHAYPVRVTEYRVRKGSGGRGRFRGGDGIIREIEFEKPAEVSIVCDRWRSRPYGLKGGGAGKSGRAFVAGSAVGGKVQRRVRAGERVRVETPGAGGWGRE